MTPIDMIGNVLMRYAAEIGLISVLAVLPYLVALREVGLTLLILGLSIGGCRLLKKRLTSRVCVDGKGVFITGCDTGIGNALARRLVSLGFRVFAGCFRPDEDGARALKASCGDSLHIVPLDVTSDDSVADALKYVNGHLGAAGLWGVVNNAGQNTCGEAELCTMNMYERIMNINMFGTVRVTKAFLPMIRRSKGRIVNVTSVHGRMGVPERAPYTMSKYAGEGFADVLRMEMRPWGVKVVLIEPGMFGHTTSILTNANLNRMRAEVDTMWEQASPQVRTDYGKGYLLAALPGEGGADDTGPGSLAPVMDAMLDGLTNEHPKARYLIGGTRKLFDTYKIIVVLRIFLPDVVTDFLIERCLWPRPLTPQALVK